MRTVIFSRDSSRKWQSQWLMGKNLDWSWCWRMLGSVSEHHSLGLGTIPHCKFTCFVIIRESTTRHVILMLDLSLLYWWYTTHMLQIVLIYHGMKLINTLSLSHPFWYWCVAGKACPVSDTFPPKFYQTRILFNNCVYFVSCCSHPDYSSWQPTYPHSVSTFMCW